MIIDSFGRILQNHNQGLSIDQVNALTHLSAGKVATFFWNMPNVSNGSFFGVPDEVVEKLICRYPFFQEINDSCRKLKNDLSQWNPTFPEAALFSAFIYINSYKGGGNKYLEQMQKNLENTCRVKIWQLANGSFNFYEKQWSRFESLVERIEEICLKMYSMTFGVMLTEGIDCSQQIEVMESHIRAIAKEPVTVNEN